MTARSPVFRPIRRVRPLRHALLLSFALGCAPALERVRPPVEPPAAFGRSGEAALPDAWWTSFEDPALDRLVRTALAGNFELRAVWDRLAQAEAEAWRAGAPLLPLVGVSAGAERIVERDASGRSSRSLFGLEGFADYEIDLWGRLRSARDAAAFESEAAEHDVRAAAVGLSAAVATAWYALAEGLAQIELLDRQIDTNERVRELVTARFLRGQAGAADVLRQRQLVEARRGERIDAEGEAKLLEHRLALLLGRPPGGPLAERPGGLPDPPPLPAAGLPADLLRRRPDVLRAHAAVLAADRRFASAVADRYPRLSLSVSASTAAEAVRDLFDGWIVGLAARVTDAVFDGGERRAEAERRRALLSEAVNGYGQALLAALGDVEDALVEEDRQARRLASLEAQLDLSRGAVERLREQYARGATAYLDVLDALLTQQALERTRLSARRARAEARIALCRALAGGWALERPEPAAPAEESP